ncbi:MAG: 50S ribosomal protein L3 [Candidatus Omnitrophica bacterium]|nr:50S ribosomal protein L3 [Candidatus Omnitrophota bacterium]
MTRIGLLGKKVGMTQIFDEEGRQVPVSVLEVGPCHVTSLQSKEKNGYSSIQLGFDRAKEKQLSKPLLGQFHKTKIPPVRFVREIRTEQTEGLQVGQQLKVNQFEVGDFIDVEGVSIGRGFQGVVKRHHFKGGASKSHGSMFGRVPGSIGASSFPSRVVKGMRAAGRMGNENVTVQSLKVVKVDLENNLLIVKGSVPGAEGGYLVIRTALRRGPKRSWKLEKPAVENSKAEGSSEEKT